MNCAECEQLIDAYLDGELSGSLRLEFDAHRLRCRRCQLTVTMMDSVGHVVAHDRQLPALADDFTDRVMAVVGRKRPLRIRLRPTRVAVVAGVLLQAAAVLYLALWLPARSTVAPEGPPDANLVAAVVSESDLGGAAWSDAKYWEIDERTDREETYFSYICARLEAAGSYQASEVNQIAQYALAFAVSDDFARASAEAYEAGPVQILLRALVPAEPVEPEAPAPSATNQHWL